MITKIKQYPVLAFIFLCFTFSWTAWLLGFAVGEGETPQIFLIIGTFGPTISALILDQFFVSKSLFKKLITFRSSPKNYLLGFLFFPVLFFGLMTFLVVFSGYQTPNFNPALLINLVFIFFMNLLLGGALGEELGWRGFLIEHLLDKYSPLLSSVFISIIWSIWHIPLFVTGIYTNPIFQYFILLVLMSFIYTYIYLNDRRSIWPLVILHASFNVSNLLLGVFFPATDGIKENDWYLFICMLLFVVVTYYLIVYRKKPEFE